MARAGGGTAVFALSEEDIRPIVTSQLQNALQPAISKVTVEWMDDAPVQPLQLQEGPVMPELEKKKTLLGYMKPKVQNGVPIEGQAPLAIPPVFDGSRLLVYKLFGQEEHPSAAKYYKSFLVTFAINLYVFTFLSLRVVRAVCTLKSVYTLLYYHTMKIGFF